MNYSTLEPISYSTPLKDYSHYGEEWQGQRSRRFAKSIRFEPRRDLIKSSASLLIKISIFPIKLPLQVEFTLTSLRVYKSRFVQRFKRSLRFSTGTHERARSGRCNSDLLNPFDGQKGCTTSR